MPFGAVYGALFFGLFCLWLLLAGVETPVGSLLAPRLFLALVGLSLALGLTLRRSWARWGGVAFAALLALASLRLATLGLGVAPLLFLFGSLAAVLLLVIPATGDLRSPRPAAMPRLGRLLGWSAITGLGAFAASLTFLELPGRGVGDARLGRAAAASPASVAADRVRWSDFGRGLERAKLESKPLMVTFITNWCGYCKKMDRTTWKDPAVVKRLGQIVAVRVDADEQRIRNGYTGAELAARYAVNGTPTLLLLNDRGELLSRTSGYLDPGQLLGWLDDSLTGAGRDAGIGATRVRRP